MRSDVAASFNDDRCKPVQKNSCMVPWRECLLQKREHLDFTVPTSGFRLLPPTRENVSSSPRDWDIWWQYAHFGLIVSTCNLQSMPREARMKIVGTFSPSQ